MHGSERKLRVAMVAACPFPCPRGTPTRVHRLVETLARRGHELHVVACHLHSGEGASEPGLSIHRIPHVPTYRRLEPGPTVQKLLVVDPLLRMELKTLVREYRPEVIHAHHYEGMLVSLGLEPGEARPLTFDAHTLLDVLPAELAELPRRLPYAEIALNPRIDCSGVSHKLLNYMAAGKAVVSFAGSATGLRHGQTGWVVPDGDVDGFAAAILRLLQNAELSGRLLRGAQRFARPERSWEAMAARAEAVYLDLLSMRG